MAKSKASYIVMLVLAAAIGGMLLYIIPYRFRLNQTTTYKEESIKLALDVPLQNGVQIIYTYDE